MKKVINLKIKLYGQTPEGEQTDVDARQGKVLMQKIASLVKEVDGVEAQIHVEIVQEVLKKDVEEGKVNVKQ